MDPLLGMDVCDSDPAEGEAKAAPLRRPGGEEAGLGAREAVCLAERDSAEPVRTGVLKRIVDAFEREKQLREQRAVATLRWAQDHPDEVEVEVYAKLAARSLRSQL